MSKLKRRFAMATKRTGDSSLARSEFFGRAHGQNKGGLTRNTAAKLLKSTDKVSRKKIHQSYT